MLQRLTGNLDSLVLCGVASHAEPGTIELPLNPDEAAHGGMATVSMNVAVRCPSCDSAQSVTCSRCDGRRTMDERFSAWLAIPPEVADGTRVEPSAVLPGMLRPVSFRVRVRQAA